MITKTSIPIPLGGYILVQRCELDDVTRGGVLLPVSARQTIMAQLGKGVIIALGTGPTYDNGTIGKFHVAKGQKVLFSSHLAIEVEHEGEKYLVMTQDAIFARLDE